MNEDELIESLRAGVGRTIAFMGEMTDFHGGPVNTEYLLVSDLLREFLTRHHDVCVEGLNRKFCGPLSSSDSLAARQILKGKRTDVVVGNLMAPKAIIEVKIRIKRYSGLESDLRKLRDTIDQMKPSRKRSIIGVSLFEVHTKPTRRRTQFADFVPVVKAFEVNLEKEIQQHRSDFANYSLTLEHLMASATDGIVNQALDEDGDGTPMLGIAGHTTRYYAIIMKHKLYGSAPTSTFAEMKAESGR